jgi:tetratricopeptide (TPR) repeat protein
MKTHLLLLTAVTVSLIFTGGCSRLGGDTVHQYDLGKATVPLKQEAIITQEFDPECSYFYFLWGRYAEVSGLLNEALEAYEKALICDPDNDWITRKIPVVLLRLNRVDEAKKHLQQYLIRNPCDIDSRTMLAMVFTHQKLYENAIEQYNYIYRKQPHSPRTLLLIGELYFDLHLFDKAQQTLEKFIAISDAPYPGLVLLARLFVYKNQLPQAVKQYKIALEINRSPELELELAKLYLQKKKYPEAEKIYRRLLSEDETDEKVAMSLVNVYLLQKKFQEAHRELTRLRDISTDLEQLELSLGLLHIRQKQFNKAIEVLTTLLAREDSYRALYLLGLAFTWEDKHEEALIQLEQISPEAEEHEDAVLLQVRILNLLHRHEEGILILDEILSTDDQQSVALFILLANMHKQQGNNLAGEDTFKRAFAVHPDHDELLYEFGLFIDRQGDRARAMSMMKKVINLNYDHAGALNFVGYTWADRGENLEKALEYIKRAVLLKPENGYIRDSLGWVYYRLGYMDKAIKELEKALQLAPDDPEILEHLGEVYITTGLREKGLATYKKAVKFFEKDEDKKRVLEKIRIVEEGEGN